MTTRDPQLKRGFITARIALAAILSAVGTLSPMVSVAAQAEPQAPNTTQDPPLYEFGEIVVTGKRPRVVDEVTTVDVVTSDDIERSGARTVDEAIDLLPGLYVRRGAQGVRLIDIRGLRTRNVLLMLDGVPLNSSFDGLFDPSTLSVENVAQIKLTRGASSMLYGPGGNAGVLNIVTRAAGEKSDASILVESGLSQSYNLRGQASIRRGDLGLVFAGSLFDQDHFELSDDFEPTDLEDGGQRLNSDRRDGTAFASMTLDASDNTSFGLNLNYHTVERGKPPVTEDSRSSPFAPRARFERTDQDSLSLHSALRNEIGESLVLRPALYFNRADELTDAFDDDTFSTQESPGAFREDATTATVGAALQVELRRSTWALATFGLDVRDERWEATGFVVEAAGGGDAGGGGGPGGGSGDGGSGSGSQGSAVPFDDDHSSRIVSLAFEVELDPEGKFAAVLGAGLAAQNREEAATEDDYQFLLGGSYSVGRSSTLRASVARQVRFPTLRDLYGVDRGNPELGAERTLNYEIAIDHAHRTKDLELGLALFCIDADDFIERVPNDVLRNVQETRFQGVEIEGRHGWERALRLRWSYTYLDAENRSPQADIPTTQNRPRHKVAVVLERDFASGLRLRGDLLWVADSYALSRTRPTTAMELGDYADLSVSVSKSLLTEQLRVIARISNLLDESYVESIGFPAPGRTVFLGLQVRWGVGTGPG